MLRILSHAPCLLDDESSKLRLRYGYVTVMLRIRYGFFRMHHVYWMADPQSYGQNNFALQNFLSCLSTKSPVITA